ncbi:MAG: TIGR00282 family metallophosphoesterase [Clostridia bacterium]|nr:TIGR00282 family metallophosphoesterase [Clostridia bacterium]MDY2929479.1 TIGR00282 family metallophosphoesterase [Clostridiaceae bacterium]
MVILAIGDVVGDPGMDILCRRLGRLQRQVGADLTVVNGENATGRGITPALAEDIFYAGADVITLGNHTFANRQICDYLDEQPHILRPLNLPAQQPGQGSVVAEVQGRRVCVANLQGRVGMDYNVSSPFSAADALLRETEADLFLLDFHAEATSEKLAMGYHLAGRAAAVWGTHTHVPTADERILPGGTGYITDVGMTGGFDSVLGVRWEQSVAMFRGELAPRFQSSDRNKQIQGAVFTIDNSTGCCTQVQRVVFS